MGQPHKCHNSHSNSPNTLLWALVLCCAVLHAAAASGACGRARGMSQGETWSMPMTDAGAKGKQRPGTDKFIMRR